MCSLQVMLSSSLIWVCSCFTAAEANEVKTVSSYMLGSTILLPVPLLRHIWLQNKNPPWASIWNRAVLEESLEAHVNVSFVSIDDSPAIRPMQRNKDIEFLSTSFFLFIIYNLKVLFHQACYEINTDIISHKEGVSPRFLCRWSLIQSITTRSITKLSVRFNGLRVRWVSDLI